MNARRFSETRSLFAGILGASLLLGAPAIAQTDQGKWWNPEARRPGERIERNRVHRQAPRDRIVRHRRGGVVIRDRVYLREGRRGPWFHAPRWHSRPRFHGRFIYVRPVRYFLTADACVGGFGISARFEDHELYGCNFCDARFGRYSSYSRHVAHCEAAPDGYSVSARAWDDPYWDEYEDSDGSDRWED